MGDRPTNMALISQINRTPLPSQPSIPSGLKQSHCQDTRFIAFVRIGPMTLLPGKITVSVMVLSTNSPHLIPLHKMDWLNGRSVRQWTMSALYFVTLD